MACAFQPMSVLGPKKGDKKKLKELVKILEDLWMRGRSIRTHKMDPLCKDKI